MSTINYEKCIQKGRQTKREFGKKISPSLFLSPSSPGPDFVWYYKTNLFIHVVSSTPYAVLHFTLTRITPTGVWGAFNNLLLFWLRNVDQSMSFKRESQAVIPFTYMWSCFSARNPLWPKILKFNSWIPSMHLSSLSTHYVNRLSFVKVSSLTNCLSALLLAPLARLSLAWIIPAPRLVWLSQGW